MAVTLTTSPTSLAPATRPSLPAVETIACDGHQGGGAGWTAARLSLLGAFVVAAVLATLHPWIDIARWAIGDEEASHVLLVLPLAAWIAYVRRARLAGIRPAGSLLGPALVAAGWAFCHYGYNHATQVAWHGGALLVVVGAALAVAGTRVAAALWPALLILAFLVPVPGMVRQQIAGPLQNTTARAVAWILSTCGAPVARQGNSLLINGNPVLVAEACNGMRMIFPLILIVYTFCFSLPLRAGVRAMLLLASPACAIGCNVLRVIPAVLLHGYGSARAAQGYHDVSGWLMLPVAFLLLMALIRALRAMHVPVMVKQR